MAMPPEEDKARAIGNMRKKFGEVWPCGFCVMQVDRQTYSLQYLHPSWVEVIIHLKNILLLLTQITIAI